MKVFILTFLLLNSCSDSGVERKSIPFRDEKEIQRPIEPNKVLTSPAEISNP